MNINKFSENLAFDLLQTGFNLFGVSAIEEYDRLVKPEYRLADAYPGMKRIILFGSGGKIFWQKLTEFQKEKVGSFLSDSLDPIDDYTEYQVNLLLKKFAPELAQVIYPFKKHNPFVDFSKLAVISGFGYLSPLIKLVLHPVYGSWISLRGAFLTEKLLELTPVKNEFKPCENCHKPCLSACPVKAINENSFNFSVCFEHRNQEIDCLDFCQVRKECVIGPEHRYSQAEGIHRNKSSLKSMREYFT